jgi:pyridoxine 5-phosphate synthase
MAVLSVNVNKVAVLRNSRGGALPDVLAAARVAAASGAGGITVHPRPDRRHIRPEDVERLATAIQGRSGNPADAPLRACEFNIEGNPFAGPRPGYPGFMELVLATRPTQATLVPDGDAQVTSDHGFDLARDAARLAPLVARLRAAGCRVSLFMDVDTADFAPAAAVGAHRVELYTGPYADAFAAGDREPALAACARAAERAAAAGLAVNAGHDLDQQNLGPLLAAVPRISEVSIGHALFGEALYDGLAPTVQRYLAIIAGSRATSTEP